MNKTRKKVLIILLLIGLLGYMFCLPKDLFTTPYSTVVLDREGELLGARTATDGQWRFPTQKVVPEKFKEAIITFEDQYFFYHIGVNPISISRALWQNIKQKRIVSGGSTITMQVIRLSRNKPRTLKEKIIEALLATRLELRYSKKEILAFYSSHAPFGGNVVGVSAASWRYFGHSSHDLSWAEAATLAVLPNSPALIHLSRSRDQLLIKRNRLLKKLMDKGKIDKETYELALTEPLPHKPLALPQIAPYFVDKCYKNKKGTLVRSTLDKSVQEQVEEILQRWNNQFRRSEIRHLSALIIDVETNEIISYCGNVGYEEQGRGNQVDILQAPRSTGSILKPFLYAAALDEGLILPHTLLPDVPINFSGFSPQNFNLQFEGAAPASEVIIRSLNVPSVDLLRKYSVPKFYNLLKNMGFSTLNKPSSYYGLSLILGGSEASLYEVTRAYANMARILLDYPIYQELKESVDENKTTVEKGVSNYSQGAVWQLFEAIKNVYRPEEVDWQSLVSMQNIAWKTGTSYGFRDAWAVGVTPKYAIGVWAGNATGEGKPELVGTRTAAPVLFDLFNALPSSDWFDVPSGEFVDAEVCSLSGHLKGRYCTEVVSQLVLPQAMRTAPCPYHQQITVTLDHQFRVKKECMENEPTTQISWFILPPSWAWLYKQHHPEYQLLPPLMEGCSETLINSMEFIYPQPFTRISLPKQMDGSKGRVTFELAHSEQNSTVYWHLDDTYITQTKNFHTITLSPDKGKHALTVVDDSGQTVSIVFFVE